MSSQKSNPIIREQVTLFEAKEAGQRIGIDWPSARFDVEDLRDGIMHEKEHADVTGGDLDETAKIAWEHLRGCSDYYKRLAPVERACEVPNQGAGAALAAVSLVSPVEEIIIGSAVGAAVAKSKKNPARKHNQKGYKYWVVLDGKIFTGNEYREDAYDAKRDLDEPWRSKAKVYTRLGLRKIGINPDENGDWGEPAEWKTRRENPPCACALKNTASRSTTVQTLMFDKAKWTPETAKAWAKSHGFKHGKVDAKGPTVLRIRQIPPDKFREFAGTVPFGKGTGIQAVVGFLKEGKNPTAEMPNPRLRSVVPGDAKICDNGGNVIEDPIAYLIDALVRGEKWPSFMIRRLDQEEYLGGIDFELISPLRSLHHSWYWPTSELGITEHYDHQKPRYDSLRDAVVASLKMDPTKIFVFGRARGSMGEVYSGGIRARDGNPFFSNPDYLKGGTVEKWWRDLVSKLPDGKPIKWLGSDDPMN